MSGSWCTGVATDNRQHLLDVRAYAEGAEYRLGGTALQRPITDNPHTVSASAIASWVAGWTDADGGTIEGCVADPTRTAPT